MKNRIRIWSYLVKRGNQVKCMARVLETEALLKKDKEKTELNLR